MADAPMSPDGTPRDLYDYLTKRISAMKTERTSFIDQWRSLADFVKPRRGRFFIQDRNKGDRRWSNIINSIATQALRTARGGFMAGTMSPARPWFSFETIDKGLMEFPPVKDWLYVVEMMIRSILTDSNFYSMVPLLLQELLLFGTGAMSHVDDFHDVARFYTHTIGSYMLGLDDKLRVRTFAREYEDQVSKIVAQFGYENCSKQVKSAYDRSNYDNWFPVNHFVEANPAFKPGNKFSKPFRSIYFEPGNRDGMLQQAGFHEFPVYCPRWEVTDQDIYGTDCPGMTALGDVKGLQVMERRKAQGLDKVVSPPLKGPPTLKNVPVSSLPGGLTVYAADPNAEVLSPVYEVRLPLQEIRLDMDAVEKRINSAFYVDLFMAISTMEGIQPRNQFDLMQRNQERLLQLGPVLEQIHGEFLRGVIERTFNQAVRANILPVAPPELAGQELKLKFISPLALAQRAAATGNIERMVAFVSQLALGGMPGALDKFDADQAVDEYAQAIGAPPSIVVPDQIVEQNRKVKQMQQSLATSAALVNSAADTTNKLAAAKTVEPSVLSNLSQAMVQRYQGGNK